MKIYVVIALLALLTLASAVSQKPSANVSCLLKGHVVQVPYDVCLKHGGEVLHKPVIMPCYGFYCKRMSA